MTKRQQVEELERIYKFMQIHWPIPEFILYQTTMVGVFYSMN